MNARRMPPALGAHGNVLEIGVARREPSRRGPCLLVQRVHSAIAPVDLLRQGVEVGRAELGQRSILEQPRREWVLLGQLLEHLLPGGERSARSPRAALETQRLEQHLGNLRAAVEIDLLAGGQMQLAAQRVDLRARRGRHLAQHLRIEPDAGALHVEERRKERPLETLVEIPLVARLELRKRPDDPAHFDATVEVAELHAAP